MTQPITFATPQEALQHYGVVGMKWGKTRVKADAVDIRSARRSIQKKAIDLDAKREAVSATKKGSHERVDAKADYAKMKTSFLKDPDRVTAVRLTRGEKAIVAIFPFGLTTIAATSAASRRIERKQDLGKYDKKKKS